MVAWLADLGMALLGVAVARTRTVTRWSWIALVVCGLIAFVPFPFDGEICEVFIGVPFAIAMGLALRHTDARTAPPGRPTRSRHDGKAAAADSPAGPCHPPRSALVTKQRHCAEFDGGGREGLNDWFIPG